MPFFHECPYCHCNLDPNEQCDCPESSRDRIPTQAPQIEPPMRRASPYERIQARVQATGNRWAIENFKATH